MTLIIGLVHEGTVYLACDSCGSDGHTYSLMATPKLFKNGELGIGYTSSFRMAQLLEFSFTPPARPPETPALTYLVRDVVPSLRQAFKEGGYTTVNNNQETGGQFLVALDDQLFNIHDNFSVLTVRQPFAAVGSGEEAALGALWATAHMNLPPDQRLLLALQAAEAMITTVRGPFFVMRGDNTEARPLLQETL